MQNIQESVSGKICAVNILLELIEFHYLHTEHKSEACVKIKHIANWKDNRKSFEAMRVDEIESELINQEISGLSIFSGGAEFKIGSRHVEVVQLGPTEYLELWWEVGDDILWQYI